MNVLGFMASPRKGGNSDVLLDRFLEGARSQGAQAEKIYLYDCSIEYCQGCHLRCWSTPDCCSRWQDDMHMLHDKMIASDLLIFSSPVYMGTPPAKMIAFFERSIDQKRVNLETLTVESNTLRGKKAVVLQVNFFNDPAYQRLPLSVYERILAEIFGMTIIGSLGVEGVAEPGDIAGKKAALQEAYNLGAALCGSCDSR
jgi:multimeric flavodoxin WrbA